MEFEWNISQDSPHCSWSTKSKSSLTQMGETRIVPRTNYLHVDVSMTSYGEFKTMKGNPLLIPHLCLCLQKDFQQDNWSILLDLDQKQSGMSTYQRKTP